MDKLRRRRRQRALSAAAATSAQSAQSVSSPSLSSGSQQHSVVATAPSPSTQTQAKRSSSSGAAAALIIGSAGRHQSFSATSSGTSSPSSDAASSVSWIAPLMEAGITEAMFTDDLLAPRLPDLMGGGAQHNLDALLDHVLPDTSSLGNVKSEPQIMMDGTWHWSWGAHSLTELCVQRFVDDVISSSVGASH
jgi:hypothetical protein